MNAYKRQQIPTIFPKYLAPQQKNPNPITIEGGIYTFGANTPKGQFSDIVSKGNTRTNLIPTFDSVKWILNSTTVDSPTKITVNVTGSSNFGYVELEVKANVNYTIDIITVNGLYVVTDVSGTGIDGVGYSKNKRTFNSGSNTEIRIYLRAPSAGIYVFENAIMEEGNIVGNFITGTKSTLPVRLQSKDSLGVVQGEITTPAGVTYRSLPNGTNDEYSVTDEKHTQNISDDYTILTTELSLLATGTNNKRFLMTLPNYKGYASSSTIVDNLVPSTFGLTTPADWDIVANRDKLYVSTQNIVFIVDVTLSDVDAKAYITNQTLNYQLMLEKVTYHPDQELVTGPGWTISVESDEIDAGNSTMPTLIISPPPGLLLPITIEQKDFFEPTYLDQDFILT